MGLLEIPGVLEGRIMYLIGSAFHIGSWYRIMIV